MITHETITKGQAKWLALITEFYPDLVETGSITHRQLQETNAWFRKMRTVDKDKYKTGWPIWLIVNNAVSRGVYQLPIPGAVNTVKSEAVVHEDTEQRRAYTAELASFGL